MTMTLYSPVWGYVRLAVDCISCEGGGSFACDLFARAFPTEGGRRSPLFIFPSPFCR